MFPQDIDIVYVKGYYLQHMTSNIKHINFNLTLHQFNAKECLHLNSGVLP